MKQTLLLFVIGLFFKIHYCQISCPYNLPYIYFINDQFNYSGTYLLRNESFGCAGNGPPNPSFKGSFIYELFESDPPIYMYQVREFFGGSTFHHYICIASFDLNAPAFDQFRSCPGPGGDIITCGNANGIIPDDATFCDWQNVDQNNGIIWSNLVGPTYLCDENTMNGVPDVCDPTSPPTTAPTSSSPTQTPTISPSIGTTMPTQDTLIPTITPSETPTQKPTPLPTPTQILFNEPACPGLQILFLEQIFPGDQNSPYFNEIPGTIYNQRRVWTNGFVNVYYSDTLGLLGRWVMSNGTYYLISETVNTPNMSLPGDLAEIYDHFPSNNIYLPPDIQYTFIFDCDGMYLKIIIIYSEINIKNNI